MFNKVIMIGNLTRNIELKYIPSGSAIAKSSIAQMDCNCSEFDKKREE